MKIISKQKDFYDYLTGIYGIDEKKVIDRRGWEKNSPGFGNNTDSLFETKSFEPNKGKPELITRRFAILGMFYRVNYYDGKVSFPEWSKERRVYRGKALRKGVPYSPKTTDLNKKHRLPFLHINRWDNEEPIIMSNYLLNKLFDADTIYKELDLFLGYLVDNPPIENNQTNDEKIKSNGFDLKTSFRNIKKKKKYDK